MGYDDKMNNELVATIREDMRKEREKDVAGAGALFNERTRAQIEYKISDATRLPAADVKDIVDTIDKLAGEDGANAKQVIKYALEGHIKKEAFVNHLSGELEGTVKTSIADREQRILDNKAKPAEPAANLSVKTPAPQRP